MIALGVALVAGLNEAAAERKRIAVIDFSGVAADSFQRDVENVLKKSHSVIPGDEYAAAAKKLDATKPTAKNVSRVAQRLNLDGVLIGHVKRKEQQYQLTLQMREGTSGEFAATVTLMTSKANLSAAEQRTVKSKLFAVIDDLPAPNGDGNEDGDGDGNDELVATAATRDAASAAAPITDSERADLGARDRGLDVAGGVSVISRRLTFSATANLGNAPQGYRGGPVAGAYLTIDLYPLAFGARKRSLARDLGLTAIVDRVVKIESRLSYTDDDSGMQVDATLPTSQSRFGVGAILRHNFGNRATSPSLKASLRYNRMKFIIDREGVPADKIDIPSIDYTFIDPGIGLNYPLSTRVALFVEGRFLWITSTGEMQQADQYGSASVTGVEGDARIEYRINRRLFFRIGGRFMTIGFAFAGTGALTTGRDGDDATLDVGGARDSYLGGYGLAGYSF